MLVGTYNDTVPKANGVRSLTVFLIVMGDGEDFAPLVLLRPKGRLREKKFKSTPGPHQTPLWLED